MVFGMLPLMFANGVGANGNRSVGVCTVGGMMLGTIGLLLIVPVLFTLFQSIQEKLKRNSLAKINLSDIYVGTHWN